jgi:hypothetical protein
MSNQSFFNMRRVFNWKVNTTFVKKKDVWSIGIYTGKSPLKLTEIKKNPILTAKDIHDIPADFVADPFMLKHKSGWYMFFEVMNSRTKKGEIGLAISKDGFNWEYKKIVLNEPFHLSYPYVFKVRNIYYMIPETRQANSIRLYKSVDFPQRWSYVKTLLKGDYSDASVFYYDNKWWMFTIKNTTGNGTLYLYWANNLKGSWIEHIKSPIVKGNAKIARPAGRVLVLNKRIIRYAQDDNKVYGKKIRAFEITKLNKKSYKEKEINSNLILKKRWIGWNSERMHHIDAHKISKNKWIACMDGYQSFLIFRFKEQV